MWAAQLSDDRYLPAIEKQLAQDGPGDGRPPLRGHSPEVAALYMVANQIRLWMRAQGAEIDMIKGPAGPADRLNEREMTTTMTWFNGLWR